MGKEKHKCTLRLSTDEIEQIEAYPGKNFTEKARSLFAAHAVEMDELPGEDLKEKYEILLKGYLSKFEPELWKEIESRREELKRYAVIRQIKCGLIPQIKNDFLRYAEAL